MAEKEEEEKEEEMKEEGGGRGRKRKGKEIAGVSDTQTQRHGRFCVVRECTVSRVPVLLTRARFPLAREKLCAGLIETSVPRPPPSSPSRPDVRQRRGGEQLVIK